MLKEILDILRKHSALEEIEHNFGKMLDISEDMFIKASAPLEDHNFDKDLREYLWSKDREINNWEENIRRRLYTHLVVVGCATADLSMIMAFISIVKNAERLGDFVKNIHRVMQFASSETPDASAKLLRLRHHIAKQFASIKEVLASNDKARAQQIVEFTKRDQKTCEEYISSLVEGRSDLIECNNPVACAMLIRYFKRILSHQRNIAQSVYQPFKE